MIRIEVPFVHTVYGRIRPKRVYRDRRLIDRRVVEIPSIQTLPPPKYAIEKMDGTEAQWYELDGVLMRSVMMGDFPATLAMIQRETSLISPRSGDWFHDHPSAVHIAPKKHRVDPAVEKSIPGQTVLRTNWQERSEATAEIYSRCYEHKGMLLKPASPPTIEVLWSRRMAVFDISVDRWRSANVPVYHFDISQFEAAKAWAVELVGKKRVAALDKLPYVHPDHRSGYFPGAEATARSFARDFLYHHSRLTISELGERRVKVLLGLRHIYEGEAQDLEAGPLLQEMHELDWPVMPKGMRRLISELGSWCDATMSTAKSDDLDALNDVRP